MTASALRLCTWLAAAGLLGLPGLARAHAFAERYDLPVPLRYFVAGAAATVALSFVVVAIFVRGAAQTPRSEPRVLPLGPRARAAVAIVRLLAVCVFALIVIAGLGGNLNPEMNPAPVLVWILWWVGFAYFAALIGNCWNVVDPSRAIFDWAAALARRMGRPAGIALGMAYPRGIGMWPAVLLLLAFVWVEVIYPQAVSPAHVAVIALTWFAFNFSGMVLFGAPTWRGNADVFAIYFDMLGRFAPLGASGDGRGIVLRPLGHALVAPALRSIAQVGFVVAMLATVLFDGLLGTAYMKDAVHAAIRCLPVLAEGPHYSIGTFGLVAVWLAFMGAYLASSVATALLVQRRSSREVALLFAPTLVPIGIAYTIAHYFSYLIAQGQLIIPLLSDPLGRGWNLFGTAGYVPDIGIVGARFAWQLAIIAIVGGHVVAIWLAHRVALREYATPRVAVLASVPLTILMVLLTAISLLIMAEPLTAYAAQAAAAPIAR